MIRSKQLLKSKQGFEMPFAWLFAIIVGGVILFLAIFAATSFIQTSKYRYYTETANEIKNYLNPLVTGLASAESPVPIRFKEETRTYFYCNEPNARNFFGTQLISFSEKSRLGKEWEDPGGNISVYNKYVFANDTEQGKILYLAAMPFFIGFKVDDLIFINSQEYCFIKPPNTIEKQSVVFENVNITNNTQQCTNDQIAVCFSETGFFYEGCDMLVKGNNQDYTEGYVMKESGETLHFVDNLLYAAVFSSPEIYRCNIKRLGRKTSELAYIYKEKIELASVRECNSILGGYLDNLADSAEVINNTNELIAIKTYADSMDVENKKALCQIYKGEDY